MSSKSEAYESDILSRRMLRPTQGFSLFIGAGLAALFYFVLARSTALAAAPVPTT